MIAECGYDMRREKGWRMKRMVFVSLVMVGLLYAGPLAALDNPGPKIEIREMRYDFGTVVQGTTAEHVFEIKNVGNEPLIIEKVQSG
jgi:hypothetical protein